MITIEAARQDAYADVRKASAAPGEYGNLKLERRPEWEIARLCHKKIEKVLLSVIARTDPELAAHQTRVADLSLEIAREMGLGEKRCMEIHAGALLHDVGRILLPTPAIDATDTSSDKFDLVRRHPLDGWRMLANADLPESVKSIVLWHHERCDGSGYPDRLKRDEIPLEARIVAVADAFETWLFSAPSGPCGRALNHSVASNELSRKAGIHYDLTASMVCLWLFNVRGYRFCSSIS